MADTTPISNSLNIRVSHVLEDILTAGADNGVTATTNGNAFTYSMRNEALAEAYAYLGQTFVNKFTPIGAEKLCEGLVATQSVTFSASGTAINKDFIAPIRLIKSTGVIYHQGIKSHFDSDMEPLLDYGFAIEGNKVYGYERAAGVMAVLSTGTATLYYIKADRTNTTTGAVVAANTSPDTTIDPQYHDFLVGYAAARLAQQKGAGEWVVKAPTLMQMALGLLPNG